MIARRIKKGIPINLNYVVSNAVLHSFVAGPYKQEDYLMAYRTSLFMSHGNGYLLDLDKDVWKDAYEGIEGFMEVFSCSFFPLSA